MKNVLAILLCSMFLVGCVDGDKQKLIDEQLDKIKVLKEEIEVAKQKYEAGSLTSGEFKLLLASTESQLKESHKMVEGLKEDGVGYGELIGAVAMGILSRGIPSKGPLPLLLKGITALFRRKKE